jgi:hypothetical protein
MTKHRSNGLAVLIVTTSLIGFLAGHVQAAVSSPTLPESVSSHAGGANLEKHNILHNILIAAAPVPKTSVPQVHVNVGTHINTGSVDRATGPNSSAFRFEGTHRFNKDIGGKRNAVAWHSRTGDGASIRSLSFTHVQVEYKPQSDNGSLGNLAMVRASNRNAWWHGNTAPPNEYLRFFEVSLAIKPMK